MMNCVIIDDEPLAREGLTSYVREVDFLNLTGTCQHPLELMTLLDTQPVDLIFLDIQMPKMSGIDFLKIAQHPPLVIITTAYPSFALEGFQLNVLDYLLKPITFERFLKSANKAKDYHRLLTKPATLNQHKPEPVADYFFIKCGTKYEKILVDAILYIEGMQNYVTLVTDSGKYVTLLSLKNLEESLAGKPFIRVHKSYLVAMDRIDSIDGNQINIQSYCLPISRNYREQVLTKVLAKKLWKK